MTNDVHHEIICGGNANGNPAQDKDEDGNGNDNTEDEDGMISYFYCSLRFSGSALMVFGVSATAYVATTKVLNAV